MKLKRVIQLPTKTKENLTLEMDVDENNFLYSVDLMEKRVQEVYAFYKGEVKVPKSTPIKDPVVKAHIKLKEKMTKKKNTSSEEGTAFDSIAEDAKDFNAFNVKITRIGEEASGETAGKEWAMQSLTIEDYQQEERTVIAWRDQIDLFRSLRVGDMIDVIDISEYSEYTLKGNIKKQFVLGKKSVIQGAE